MLPSPARVRRMALPCQRSLRAARSFAGSPSPWQSRRETARLHPRKSRVSACLQQISGSAPQKSARSQCGRAKGARRVRGRGPEGPPRQPCVSRPCPSGPRQECGPARPSTARTHSAMPPDRRAGLLLPPSRIRAARPSAGRRNCSSVRRTARWSASRATPGAARRASSRQRAPARRARRPPRPMRRGWRPVPGSCPERLPPPGPAGRERPWDRARRRRFPAGAAAAPRP